MPNELLSALAILLTLGLFVPYIVGIHRGKIQPHVFSWVIWGLGTLIVFFAQLAAGAGVGAWAIGVSGLITSYIALVAYIRRLDTHITRSDWIFFLVSLSALPFWFATADPLWAVAILTLSDTVAFGPTLRRAYHRPYEESPLFFCLIGLRNLIVILALESYTLATALFPAVVGAACFLVTIVLVLRRQIVSSAQA